MALTPGDFRTSLPEFSGVDASVITQYLDQAARNMNVATWAARYNDGQLYLTAHLIATFASDTSASGDAGPMTAKRVGEINASYAVGDWFKNSSLGTTKYGRHFLELQALVYPQACRCL